MIRKITFLHTVCHNSDMLRSILIIFTELLSISTAYTKTIDYLSALKFVLKVSAGSIKLVFSSGKLVHKMRRLHFYRILQ
jgi:hypothetical protein